MWTHLPKQPRSNHPLLLKPLKSQSPLGPVGGPLPKGQTWAEPQEPRRGLSADGTGNPRPQTPAQGQRSRGGVKGSHYSFLKDASPSEKGHGWKGAMQGPYKHKLRIAPQILVTLQVCAPKWQHKQNWVHLPPHSHKFQIITAFCAEKSKFSGTKFTSPMTSWRLLPSPLQFLQTTPASKF